MASIDKNFWEEKHQENDSWWLTGTPFFSLLNFHNILIEDIKDKKILEIGVGLGTCTKELSKFSKELYCCDISKEALDRVKDLSTDQFLTENLKTIPPTDIAICHLVFQHCDDIEVERILNDVKLSNDGIFSFQFAALKDNITTKSMQTLIDQGCLFFRNLETIQDIVDRSNKEIFYISDPKWWGGKNKHEWYFIKVRNKR